ncbi:hypothetical protein V1522DRAFT_399765 [Lipomyces starkeyi]
MPISYCLLIISSLSAMSAKRQQLQYFTFLHGYSDADWGASDQIWSSLSINLREENGVCDRNSIDWMRSHQS